MMECATGEEVGGGNGGSSTAVFHGRGSIFQRKAQNKKLYNPQLGGRKEKVQGSHTRVYLLGYKV